jgi:hypothetical protein
MVGEAYNTGIYALLLLLDQGNLSFLGRRWDYAQDPRGRPSF